MDEKSKNLEELFIERFNSKYETVIQPSGKQMPFQVEKLIDSLFTVGLEFRQILQVLDFIEPALKKDMETSELKSLVSKGLSEINIELAEKFQKDYSPDREIIDYPFGEETLILNSHSIKKIIRDVLSEFYFTSELESNFAKTILEICKARYSDENKIQYYQITNRVEVAIKKIYGRSLDEYTVEAKSIIKDADNTLSSLSKQKEVAHEKLINAVSDLIIPILIYFKVLPGLTPFQTVGLFTKLVNGYPDLFKNRFNKFKTELYKFFLIMKTDNLKDEIMINVPDIDILIEGLKETCRKLLTLEIGKYTLKKQESLQQVILNLKRLALFGKFLFPLTSNDLFIENIKEDTLRILYRYPSIDIISLLKEVQVHPKYMNLVISYLRKQKSITTHIVSNKTIVLLTIGGEKYCEETLGLRIKYSLPYL